MLLFSKYYYEFWFKHIPHKTHVNNELLSSDEARERGNNFAFLFCIANIVSKINIIP